MTRALGIDIGNFAIKVAEIEYSSKSRDLVGLYDIPRTEGDNPGQILKDFLANSGIKAERIALGLGGAPIFIKRMELPFSDSKRYLPAIESEIEDSLPFEMGDYVLDVQKTGKLGKLSKFLIGICPKNWVQKSNEICDAAGLIPNAYLVDSQVLGHMALHQGLPVAHEETAYCVIDLGAQTTKLSILRGYAKDPHDKKMKAPTQAGELCEFRTIHHGSSELIEWIKDRKNINLEEAKQWLIHRAEIQPESQGAGLAADLSDEIKVALRPIIVEIYQAIQSFRGRFNLQPAAVYMTGGMSDIRGLKDFLADELRVPCHPWPIFMGYNTENIPVSPEKERTFGVAMALAHRFVLSKTSEWLNFRRSSSANRKILSGSFEQMIRPEYSSFWIALFVLFSFVMSYSGIMGRTLKAENTDLIKDAASEYRRLDTNAGKAADKKAKDVDELTEAFQTAKAAKEKELKGKQQKLLAQNKSQMFLDLALALPPTVKLKSFTISSLPQGTTSRYEALVSAEKGMSANETTQLQASIEKPLTDRAYSVSFEKLSNGRELKMKVTSKGATP
jgi:Tfp pilus assembly PilM family ATPase